MPKKKSGVVADKAWNVLRLALLWARKVAVFNSKDKGSLGVGVIGQDRKATTTATHQIHCFERQLSFDNSPDLHLRKDRLAGSMRFLFPCITTAKESEEFDYDFPADVGEENYGVYGNDSRRESYLTEEEHEDDEYEGKGCEKKSQSEEEGIDSRAEKFIAEFYGQIKFQN